MSLVALLEEASLVYVKGKLSRVSGSPSDEILHVTSGPSLLFLAASFSLGVKWRDKLVMASVDWNKRACFYQDKTNTTPLRERAMFSSSYR